MSTNLQPGEYICVYHVDYTGAKEKVRKYSVTISGCMEFKIAQCPSLTDLSLLKAIFIQNVENIPKYFDILNKPLVLFTGNHFKNTSLAFMYIKNQTGEDIHFKINNSELTNIRSLEGHVPSSIFLRKNEKFMFLGIRIDQNLKSQCGMSGTTTENANKGEITPEINESLVAQYLSNTQYEDLKITFVFNQV